MGWLWRRVASWHELPMMTSQRPSVRQPIFNIPGVVLAFLAVLVGIHLLREWVLTNAGDLRVLYDYALIPARWSVAFLPDGATEVVNALSDGNAADSRWQLFLLERILRDQQSGLWTAVTHALLHGSWTHLFFNAVWLVAFGSPLARRWGAARFLVFCVVTALMGALTCYLMQPYSLIPTIGASGIVSGLFGASPWYVFDKGGAIESNLRLPRFTFKGMLRNHTTLVFLVFWFVSNYATATLPEVFTGENVNIAWQVHIGGFLAGFVLFPLIDDRLPNA